MARIQRRILIGAVAAGLLVAAVGSYVHAPAPPPAEIRPAPAGSMVDFSLNSAPSPAPDTGFMMDGMPVSLADFRGRVILLNFWATWCAPCVAEMPSLDRLEAMLGGKDFTVIALSEDLSPTAVGPFFSDHGLTRLRRYHDPAGALARAFSLRGLPTTVLIDREGRVLGRFEGPAEWDSPEAVALIRQAIGAQTGHEQI